MAKSADAFRTISEVADWLGVQTHVLRFWESKFTQVKPVKRAGGRRYYRPADMLLLGGIRKLLHDDGLTIKGVQKILREEGIAHVADLSPPLDDDTAGQLDADLVSKTDADVETAPKPTPIAESLDQAPEHSRPDAAAEPSASAPTEQGEDAGAALPSFMRGPEPSPDPDAEVTPRAPDVPTLTPEMANFDVGADMSEAGADDTPPDEANPPQETYAPVPEDVPATPPEVPVATFAPEPTVPDEVQEPAVFSFGAPETPSEAVFERGLAEETPSEAPTETPQSEPTPNAAPMFTHTESDAEPEPVAPPRPRIVDVPDDDGIEAADFSPSLLTRATTLRQLTPVQADALSPLMAQLTALRDRMARARQDPR
ncbi:MAG: MerR family transcriptional regulator [Tateyamaria sp.]|uniref:MerR family transcriptional regulator n=1 Tax=Tateyamaria sp. TaxID=1929288 RepID=UPI0032854A00